MKLLYATTHNKSVKTQRKFPINKCQLLLVMTHPLNLEFREVHTRQVKVVEMKFYHYKVIIKIEKYERFLRLHFPLLLHIDL